MSDYELIDKIGNLATFDVEGTEFTLSDVNNGGWLSDITDLIVDYSAAQVEQAERNVLLGLLGMLPVSGKKLEEKQVEQLLGKFVKYKA